MHAKRRLALAGLFFAIGIVIVLAWANWPTSPLPEKTIVDRIVVEKSRRALTLFASTKPLKTYKVSLGRAPVGSKEKQGDMKTPEGLYRVVAHKPGSSFHRALRISYPEERDLQRARAAGVNPGSDIMIHGVRNGLGLFGRLHRNVDWTAGCIALTNSEIDQIYTAVADGTVVEIRP
ncbi:MAG: L,D-transpeptidase family protein [Nibricoccus sp.]